MKSEKTILFTTEEMDSMGEFKFFKKKATAELIASCAGCDIPVKKAGLISNINEYGEKYDTLLICTTDGEYFKTSSRTFIDSFDDIVDAYLNMDAAWRSDNPMYIRLCEKDSKKYPGKTYYLAEMV